MNIPFWDKGGFDEELGGFMCLLNDGGTVDDGEKYNWYQERAALWVYSFLYNNFGQDPCHLEIARKTRDFMVKYIKAENGKWYERTYRDGRIKEGVSNNVLGWLFCANGLAEFHKATQNEEDIRMVYETIWASLRAYDNFNYEGSKDLEKFTGGVSCTGFRSLVHPMVLIRLLTQLLSHTKNSKLEALLEKHIAQITASGVRLSTVSVKR